jgi:hypothetical protein
VFLIQKTMGETPVPQFFKGLKTEIPKERSDEVPDLCSDFGFSSFLRISGFGFRISPVHPDTKTSDYLFKVLATALATSAYCLVL